ncbi:hypothetical protein SRRS_03580 [Sporomusa rhizae]|uniref:acyl-CoA dehydratase activase-related protein n=1 Tax=Sporomusa rhizae TaxID=357999 RepID=UPI00352A61E2
MSIRVGLPQGLMIFQHGKVLERFFSELGAEVVLSGETTRQTLDCGGTLDEMCLPSKVFFGHVCQLKDKVDYLFMPRLVSVCQGQYTCPKIMGMPDIVKNNAGKLPPMIDIDVDMRRQSRQVYQAIIAVGRLFGRNMLGSLYAWYKACQLSNRPQPPEWVYDGRPRIAVIGHPYIIYDRQVSLDILQKLDQLGLQVVTSQMVPQDEVDRAAAGFSKKIYWSSSHNVSGGAIALMHGNRPLSGVIFVTCFACGPDALTGELISRQAQRLDIPCMQLSLDEHTAEAGLITRLEAFTDMVKRRHSI